MANMYRCVKKLADSIQGTKDLIKKKISHVKFKSQP